MQEGFFLYRWKYIGWLAIDRSSTLARTSHRPVRYTDASGILRNADFEMNEQGKKVYTSCTIKTATVSLLFLDYIINNIQF